MEPKDEQAEMLEAVSVPELFLFILNRNLGHIINPASNIQTRAKKLPFAAGLEAELNARCGEEWTVSAPFIETPSNTHAVLVYRVLFRGEEIGTYKVNSYKSEGSDTKYTLKYSGRMPGYSHPINRGDTIGLSASNCNLSVQYTPEQIAVLSTIPTKGFPALLRLDYHYELQFADDEVRPS